MAFTRTVNPDLLNEEGHIKNEIGRARIMEMMQKYLMDLPPCCSGSLLGSLVVFSLLQESLEEQTPPQLLLARLFAEVSSELDDVMEKRAARRTCH